MGKIVLKNRLKDIRSAKGYSQEEFAKLIGVSRNTISSIERLQFTPTADTALIIAIALDMKFEDVFFFEKEDK